MRFSSKRSFQKWFCVTNVEMDIPVKGNEKIGNCDRIGTLLFKNLAFDCD